MRKRCQFQQNTIHNFQIQQQFDQLMQIQGLSSKNIQNKQLFTSIKHLFNPYTSISIIGNGINANIKSFYYLLLCHIRKEHYKKLIVDYKQKEFKDMDKDRDNEEDFILRERRVSFNDKGALFLNRPQYENYCLHKLKIFAFSNETNLKSILNTPFDNLPNFFYKNKPLTNQILQKLLSQFLSILLPKSITSSTYKQEFRSVKYHLNKNKIIGIIFTILMRWILLQKYQIESARNYNEIINDHTVCTTLCDAFAIDGLMCRDGVYQINTWCKVHSIMGDKKGMKDDIDDGGKIFFIEMFNDEFQDLGTDNERRKSIMEHKVEKNRDSFGMDYIPAFGVKDSKESSLMGADQDSEIQSSNTMNNRKKQDDSQNSMPSNSANQFRETFSNNQQHIREIIQGEMKKDNRKSQLE